MNQRAPPSTRRLNLPDRPPVRRRVTLTPGAEWLSRRLGWAVAAAVVSAVFMAWWLHWFGLVDLEVYRSGASAFVHGHNVYLAHPRVVPLPFTYPPFAAVAFVPLAVVPDLVARVGMTLISAGALLWATFSALRLAAPRWSPRSRWTAALAIAAATPLIEPVRDTFRLGQVNLVLMALVLADLVAIEAFGRTSSPRRPPDERSHRLPSGVLIGLAAAVKLTPGIFILYLLVIRRTREAITAVVTALVVTGAAWVLMPSASAHYWLHLVFDDQRIGSPGSVWNQSLQGAVARLLGSAGWGHLLWLALAGAALIAGLALAGRLYRRGDALTALGIAAVTGLLVSPISWNHHWVWAVPLGIGLAQRASVSGRRVDWWVAGGWAATFCLASMSWWPFAHQDDYHLAALYTAPADCYVLVALALMGFIAWGSWPGASPAPSAPTGRRQGGV